MYVVHEMSSSRSCSFKGDFLLHYFCWHFVRFECFECLYWLYTFRFSCSLWRFSSLFFFLPYDVQLNWSIVVLKHNFYFKYESLQVNTEPYYIIQGYFSRVNLVFCKKELQHFKWFFKLWGGLSVEKNLF